MCNLRKFNFNLFSLIGLIIVLVNQQSLFGQELTHGSTAVYARNTSLSIGDTGVDSGGGANTGVWGSGASGALPTKFAASSLPPTIADSFSSAPKTADATTAKTPEVSTTGPALTQKALIATDPTAVANSLCSIPFLGLCTGPTMPAAATTTVKTQTATTAPSVPPVAKANTAGPIPPS